MVMTCSSLCRLPVAGSHCATVDYTVGFHGAAACCRARSMLSWENGDPQNRGPPSPFTGNMGMGSRFPGKIIEGGGLYAIYSTKAEATVNRV